MADAGAERVVVEADDGGDSRRLLLAVSEGIAGALTDRLAAAFERLRRLSSREALRERGVDIGFRIEDLLALTARHADADDSATARAWLARRTPREARPALVEAPRRRPGSFWQRSRDGVLLIMGTSVAGADPCQRGCRVGLPIPNAAAAEVVLAAGSRALWGSENVTRPAALAA